VNEKEGGGTHLDARLGLGQEVVVRAVGRELHLALEVRRPPHALLLGDGRDGADAWAHEAEEGDVGRVGRDDVAHVGVPRPRVLVREPRRELLLVARRKEDEAARGGTRGGGQLGAETARARTSRGKGRTWARLAGPACAP